MTARAEGGKHTRDGECVERRSIPTVYKKIRFRSKLEADWARAFDEHGVEWSYEREGHYFGRTFYLPDFILPRSRQYVEVKGVFKPDDCRKVMALLEYSEPRPFTGDGTPDIAIVACMPDGDFYGWERGLYPVSWFEFLTKRAVKVSLFGCTKCGGRWFADPSMGWRCQCCGAYDGDSFVAFQKAAPLPWPPCPTSDDSHDVAAD